MPKKPRAKPPGAKSIGVGPGSSKTDPACPAAKYKSLGSPLSFCAWPPSLTLGLQSDGDSAAFRLTTISGRAGPVRRPKPDAGRCHLSLPNIVRLDWTRGSRDSRPLARGADMFRGKRGWVASAACRVPSSMDDKMHRGEISKLAEWHGLALGKWIPGFTTAAEASPPASFPTFTNSPHRGRLSGVRREYKSSSKDEG